MTSAEFTEWQAYYRLEPFGEVVADERHGAALALHANLNRDSKTRPKPFTPDDFIPWRAARESDEDAPILLDDAEAQSNLIRAQLFGVPPK
ncbi:hypothetical protein [Massilia sp. Leaf139]|uniref:phage tail assembly protein T n=1 Tax=Massilia sp. Leaf139 TaxID=1736272 RepID=UPI000700F3B0|nr:hypothetical protein [Massilia sp. Leaf139]KQQ90388.1 hypothetical protein ASF77_23325 [Massilia sp. Leaf139]